MNHAVALAYADLPDIDSVEPRSAADDAMFQEMAKVLAKHDALRRFGVTLLHTHFPIKEGEVLLETTNHETREQLIRPVQLSEAESRGALETSWRLGPNGETMMACKCLVTPDGSQHQGHFPT